MKSLETISDEITIFEAERDFGDITPEGLEQLAVLNLCYDLLCRTKIAQSETIHQPEKIKEPGLEDDFIPKYGVASSQLADFSFAVVTKQGSVDLRSLLREIMFRHTAKHVAEKIGVRGPTISDYFREKTGLNTDTWERIVNYCINDKI